MINTIKFLDRVQTQDYRCYEFVREVWADAFGNDIGERLKGLQQWRAIKGFTQLNAPVDPCLVLMQRWRLIPHIGIYTRGNVFHLSSYGAVFQPLRLASHGYQKVSFYQ